VISYSAGAFDINNAIASFSSRGSGQNGDVKPNIAAPGVNVRSSVATNTYASYSGTSMASPHLAAAVALMWSASPAIQGDIAATRQILDDTAIDVSDTTCGGTADDNNVWGEGRLDAYAAVLASPRGSLGTLRGTVTSGGAALAGATVSVSGPQNRTTTTAADGTYSFDRLMVGTYSISVSKFGYQTATGSATIVENQTTTANFALTAAPSAVLSGTVRLSDGTAAAGASVRAVGTPVSTTANSLGQYSMTLPHGTYQIEATHANRCASPTTVTVTISGNTLRDITLALLTDSFGYYCTTPVLPYTSGTTKLSLTGDDVVTTVTLPFTVSLYGTNYTSASVSSNGWLSFVTTTSSPYSNTAIPNTAVPNGALYPFWDDLYLDATSGVYTGVTGTAPNRTFIVEWRDVVFYSDRVARVSFVAMIGENGEITYRYNNIDGGIETGTGATIGIENGAGNTAFQYSLNEGVLSSGGGVRFRR
jgi:hypothetical protein